jgi:integrase/recombinase XerD
MPSEGNSELGRLVLTYISERRRRGDISKVTADNLRYHLWDFTAAMGARAPRRIGPADINRWLEHMVSQGIAPSTRAVRLSSVRGFARWCVLHGHIRSDWTIMTPRIRRARQVPRDLTRDHFDKILTACVDSRDELVVWLAYGCGLRCVEISRLHVDDYDVGDRLLWVRGKGSHERLVPVPQPVATAIARYLADAGHGTGPLVRPTDGAARQLTPSRISHIGGEILKHSGIRMRKGDGRTMHGLRAAAGSDVLDECEDPRVAQEFLGHANMATTSKYMRRKGLQAVREANDRRFAGPPPARAVPPVEAG